MTLHIIQLDRHECEVPGCGLPAQDWDHSIFKKNKRFKKFVDNPFNMLRACAVCNRITKLTDFWETKKWLIDFHMDGEHRFEFLGWINDPPPKFYPNDMFRIYNYIATKLDEEKI